ncbi:MAG: 4Fe-4S dicluster domain-containing protein [Thermoplasmata archaeon]
MIGKKIKKGDVGRFLSSLAGEYTVIGPVKHGSVFMFAEIDDEHPPVLDYPRTVLPVKKYLHPPRETMFEFRKGEFREMLPESRLAFFGLHICDINAIVRLDMAMASDPYYSARRGGMLIMGVECKPSEECFCKSMNADRLPHGVCDLFFREEGDGYIVYAGTEKGRKLLGSPLFHATDLAVTGISAECEEKKPLDYEKVWRSFARNHTNPLWDEMARLCLGCTNCTTVCPLCYCYDVADTSEVVPENSRRERFWDSCTLLNFATVAGGHKFRPNIKDRFRNIYTHKFKSFVDEFGLPACVGCGRCIVYCPAGINMRANLEKLEVG